VRPHWEAALVKNADFACDRAALSKAGEDQPLAGEQLAQAGSLEVARWVVAQVERPDSALSCSGELAVRLLPGEAQYEVEFARGDVLALLNRNPIQPSGICHPADDRRQAHWCERLGSEQLKPEEPAHKTWRRLASLGWRLDQQYQLDPGCDEKLRDTVRLPGR
jgi:hypothetical protein